MEKTTQTIPLSKIDLADETFSVNFMPDFERLKSSIKEIGQIQPVFLRPKGDRYQIVCGFRRVWIARDLGYSEVDARVFEEADGFKLFRMSLHENATTRGFNPVEIAIALDKLVSRFQVDRIAVVRTFLPLFSQEANEKIMNTYLALARMEDEVKTYVLKEKVSRSNIRMLSVFTPEDQKTILSLISPLKLTENRFKETLTLLEEISRRDHVAVGDIVRRHEIQAILSQKELTPSQKTERVKDILMGYRYPRLHQLEESFEKKKRELSLPPGVSLHHSPYFEGRGLKIEGQFETLEEWRSLMVALAALSETEEFQELLQDIHGKNAKLQKPDVG